MAQRLAKQLHLPPDSHSRTKPFTKGPARIFFVGIALGLFLSVAHADVFDDLFGKNKDADWQEIAAQIPVAPLQANLIKFFVYRGSTFQYFIDSASISVGSDGVVRFTTVAVSDSGARNVTFEGIRCSNMTSRRYAFLHDDGTWARAHIDDWLPIEDKTPNRLEFALADQIVCDDKLPQKDVAAVLKKLSGRKESFFW